MRKVLLGMVASVFLFNPAFAGNFGSAGSGPDGSVAKDAVNAAGHQAFDKAKQAGSSDAHAKSLRDAAKAEAGAARQDAITDERNGNVGTWVNDN